MNGTVTMNGAVSVAGAFAATGGWSLAGGGAITGNVTAGITVEGEIVVTTGGIAVTLGGIAVAAGGISIVAGGLAEVGVFTLNDISNISSITGCANYYGYNLNLGNSDGSVNGYIKMWSQNVSPNYTTISMYNTSRLQIGGTGDGVYLNGYSLEVGGDLAIDGHMVNSYNVGKTGNAVTVTYTNGSNEIYNSGTYATWYSGSTLNMSGTLNVQNSAFQYIQSGGTLEVQSGGVQYIDNGATLEIVAGGVFNLSGTLNVQNSAVEYVQSGGKVEIQSGATFLADTGSTVNINSIQLTPYAATTNITWSTALYLLPINSIFIGINAGNNSNTTDNIYIGRRAGLTSSGGYNIAIGPSSGQTQGANSIAVGSESGNTQGTQSTAIGNNAGYVQGNYGVAIGASASVNQGDCAIAIGYACAPSSQAANSILIDATGVGAVNPATTGTFITPIRNVGNNATLAYNSTTCEVTYSNSVSPQVANIIVSASTSGNISWNQPFQGSTYKKVLIYVNNAVGTATLAYTIAFVNTPFVYGYDSTRVTSVSTTGCTVTGNGTSGYLFIEGY